MILKTTFPCLIFLFASIFGFTQNETAKPFIRNFTPKEYGAAPKSFGSIQDKRGIIYIANDDGVLEYDGNSWRLISLPNKNHTHSMALDSTGTVFVGADEEMGYLKPDQTGAMKYISLNSFTDSAHLGYGSVWQIAVIEPYVYFLTQKKVFRYNKVTHKVKVCTAPEILFTLFVHNRTAYVSDTPNGLFQITPEGDLVKAKQGDFFSGDNNVILVGLPVSNDTLLLAMYRNICYYLPKSKKPVQQTYPINGEFKAMLTKNGIFYSAVRFGHDFGFLSFNKGFNIFNPKGEKTGSFTAETGLLDNAVTHAETERKGSGLWLCQVGGISRTDYPTSITYWDEKNGLPGIVEDVIRYKGKVFVNTSAGTFYLYKNKVVPVKNIEDKQGCAFHTFITGKDTLLLAMNSVGIYEIKNERATQLFFGSYAVDFFTSVRKKNRVYIAWKGQVTAMDYENGKWKDLGAIPGLTYDFRSIAEDSNGNLWLGTSLHGVCKVTLSDDWKKPLAIKLYNQANGLVSLQKCKVSRIGKELVFTTGAGLFRYNADKDSFECDTRFGEKLVDPNLELDNLLVDDKQQVWFSGNNLAYGHIAVGKQNRNGTWEWDDKPFKRIPRMRVQTIYVESNGIAWIGGSEGLFRYDQKIKQNYEVPFNTLIRKVTILKDSVIYWGGLSQTELDTGFKVDPISYQHNTVDFQFCATDYQDEKANEFCFQLEGYDKRWSEWKSDTHKEYTNLPEGTYTFCVKSKNVYGTEGSVAKFAFSIQPPWYRSWWAYLIYIFLTVDLAILFLKLYTRRLVAQKRQLEQIVEERTVEIQQQASMLKSQTEQLTELNATKDKFFSIISHDLRNPFNSIVGISQLLSEDLDNYSSEEIKYFIDLIHSTSQHTLVLLENLLRWARSQQGKIPFEPTKIVLNEVIGNCLSFLNYLALEKHITIENTNQEHIEIDADADMLNAILRNLITNSIKFTDENGEIKVSARAISNMAEITISDNGIGMNEEIRQSLFSLGKTKSQKGTKGEGGTGLGLFLCKEFVEKHGGKIWVESEPGKGSSFIFTLPLAPAVS